MRRALLRLLVLSLGSLAEPLAAADAFAEAISLRHLLICSDGKFTEAVTPFYRHAVAITGTAPRLGQH